MMWGIAVSQKTDGYNEADGKREGDEAGSDEVSVALVEPLGVRFFQASHVHVSNGSPRPTYVKGLR